MSNFPFVDGPFPSRFETLSDQELAEHVVMSMEGIGWWMRQQEEAVDIDWCMQQQDEIKEHPHGYRLATWVEDPEAPVGHALAISQLMDLPKKPHFSILSHYCEVGRRPDNHGVTRGSTTKFRLSTVFSHEQQAEAAQAVFGRKGMQRMAGLLGKIGFTLNIGEVDGLVDKHVHDGLELEHAPDIIAAEIESNRGLVEYKTEGRDLLLDAEMFFDLVNDIGDHDLRLN